jgi:hypothetical protein
MSNINIIKEIMEEKPKFAEKFVKSLRNKFTKFEKLSVDNLLESVLEKNEINIIFMKNGSTIVSVTPK